MAKKTDKPAGGLGAEEDEGLLSSLLAEENPFDRRMLWRLGSWGCAATAAVTLAVMAHQSSFSLRHNPDAAAELARQAARIQTLAKESQNESRRLASAVETLGTDRDRLFSRMMTLEQGMDSVTGAIARQSVAPSPPRPAPADPPPAPPPVIAAPAAMPIDTAPPPAPVAAAPPMDKPAKTAPAEKAAASEPSPAPAEAATAKAASAPEVGSPAAAPASPPTAKPVVASLPEPPAAKPPEPKKPAVPPGPVVMAPIPQVIAAAPAASFPDPNSSNVPPATVQRTEFGVDVGSANSVAGLRALWRSFYRARSNGPLAGLQPVAVIRERTGASGTQFRLVAGPLRDAGAAAKICAVLTESGRPCDTAVYEGQRLSMRDEPAAETTSRSTHRRRSPARRAPVVDDATRKPEAPVTLAPRERQ